MTKREFLKEHREEIDQCIKQACGENARLNNDEREIWLMNNEYLYNLARRSGVRV